VIKISRKNLFATIILGGTLVYFSFVYAVQSNDPPPFNSEASIDDQQCTDLNSTKDCYFSVRINDYNNYQAYIGRISTFVNSVEDPGVSTIKIEMCLGNGGGFGTGIACTTITDQYLFQPNTLEGNFGVGMENLEQAGFVDVHIRIEKAGSSSLVVGSGRRVHIESITVPTSKLQGQSFDVSWDSTNSENGKFYFGGPISCNISTNGGSIDDDGSTSCTGTGAGTAQIEIQQYGPVGGGADYVSDVRTIQINPIVTPPPTTSNPPPPGFVNLNFIVKDVCSGGGISGAVVKIDKDFGNGKFRTTNNDGFANFGIPQNTSNLGWSVSVSGYNDKSGTVNIVTSDVNITENLDRIAGCSGPTPTPTPTPLPGAPSCSISFSPSSGNQGSPLNITVGVQNDADNLVDYACSGSLGSGQLPPGTYSVSFPSDSQSCNGTARNSSNQISGCHGSFTVNGFPETPPPTPTIPPGSVFDSCSVVVSNPPSPSATISANPNPVNYGSSSNISWSSSNTTSCSIPGIGSGLSGGPTSTGALTSNKTYVLSCQGINGSTIFESVTVNVNSATVTISTNPTLVAYGGSSTISWSSANAASCTKSGDWSGSATPNISSSQSTGALNQIKTYTYVLTCSGNGSVAQSATVTVNPPVPATSNVTITEPNYCVSGPAATVGWTYSDPAGSPQTAYQVQITDTGNFNSPILDTSKVNSSSKAYFTGQGILQFNTTYRARVRVWNGYDVVSNWSNSSNSWKTPPYAYPQVDFNWTANGILNNPSPPINKPVTFTDQTVFNGNPNGRQWGWTFGDGGSSTTQNSTHTYLAEGSYYVTLTATDNANQSCARTKGPLIIQKPIPKWREIAPR